MPLYYKIRSKHDSRMMDLLMTNSTFSTEYFRKCFWYDGPIAEVGSARNDMLIDNKGQFQNKVKPFFHLNNQKILLYAPTFRQNETLDIYKLPFLQILHALNKRFGGTWVTLVRLHPILESKAKDLEYSDTIINASSYDDFQELLAESDVLITDYSSGLFDFIVSGKPAFFYAPDLEAYIKERNLVFDYKKLPCPFCRNIEDLLQSIESFEQKSYEKCLDDYIKFVGLKETGKASTYLANKVLKHLSNKL